MPVIPVIEMLPEPVAWQFILATSLVAAIDIEPTLGG